MIATETCGRNLVRYIAIALHTSQLSTTRRQRQILDIWTMAVHVPDKQTKNNFMLLFCYHVFYALTPFRLSPDLFIFMAFSIFFVKLYVSRRQWFAVIALIRALHEKTIQHLSLLIIFTIVFMTARHALYELVVYTVTTLKLGLNFMTTVFVSYWRTQKWNKLNE